VVSQWEKERKADRDRPNTSSLHTNDLDAKQQTAAERWAARQQTERGDEHTNTRIPSEYPEREPTPKPERGRDGPEDDL
jgi:hypothetical protein